MILILGAGRDLDMTQKGVFLVPELEWLPFYTVVPRQTRPTDNRTPRITGPGFSGTAPRQSNRKKSKKRIKKKSQTVPSVLPDSAQGAAEDSNSIPYSLGRGLCPLPY